MRSLVSLAFVVTMLCGGMALLIAYITEDEIRHLQGAYALHSVLPIPRLGYIKPYAH
jgi:hypothetical protein